MADIVTVPWEEAAGFVRARLDGKPYRLPLRWSTRESCWTIGVSLDDGTVLIDGTAVRVGYDLLRKHVDARLPPGGLVAIDTSGQDADPGRDDLRNGRVQLVYLTAAELAAAGVT